MGRPLVEDTNIIVPNVALMGNRSTFCVASTVPEGPVMVTAKTEICVSGSPRKKSSGHADRQRATYDDVGGLSEEIRKIRETVELPLKHPELFDRLGIEAPKGVLLYGPPGTGKTTLAKVIAGATSADFVKLNATTSGKKDMEEVTEKAAQTLAMYGRRTILFIDEIHRFNKSQQDYLLPFVEE